MIKINKSLTFYLLFLNYILIVECYSKYSKFNYLKDMESKEIMLKIEEISDLLLEYKLTKEELYNNFKMNKFDCKENILKILKSNSD